MLSSQTQAASANKWEGLFEAALLEHNPAMLPLRLQIAKDAILDRIEDSFSTVSLSERRSLLAALNAVAELHRLFKLDDLPESGSAPAFGHAA